MVLIDDEILASAHLSEDDVRLELAIALYQQRRLTQRQAAQLAKLSGEAFEGILAERDIYDPFNESDLVHDLETMKINRAKRGGSK